MNIITKASAQWASRPADERFANVFDLQAHLQHRQDLSQEIERSFESMSIIAQGNDVRLQGPRGVATLTNHAFNQLASLVGMSGKSLSSDSSLFQNQDRGAAWVAEALNEGLQKRVRDIATSEGRMSDKSNLLVQMPNGNPLPKVRAFNTEKFSRIWDLEVIQKLLIPLVEYGFTNPAAMDGPAGLYASDRDMFALMAPQNVQRINMPDMPESDSSFGGFEIGGQVFYPFIMLGNAEVGGASAWFTAGLLQYICGNHILWGVRDVVDLRVRHVGKAWERIKEGFYTFMRQWITAGTHGERQAIQAAMEFHIAKDANGVVTFLRSKGFTKKASEAAVKTVESGDASTGIISQDPTILFNLVSALTANARTIEHQDAKVAAETQASKLLDLVPL